MNREEALDTIYKVIGLSIAHWIFYWWAKRKIRRLGGPSWAAYGFASVMAALSSESMRKGADVDKEQAENAVRVLWGKPEVAK